MLGITKSITHALPSRILEQIGTDNLNIALSAAESRDRAVNLVIQGGKASAGNDTWAQV